MTDKTHIPCIVCKGKALWKYMPGDENYCDECVPRGCSCNNELKDGIDYDSVEAENPDNYYERLDEKGRKLPCCEFWQIAEEDHNDKIYLALGWETYYKYNIEERNLKREIERWVNKFRGHSNH